MTAPSRMGRRLTAPFERGADTMTLRMRVGDSATATVDSYDFADHVARFDVQPEPRYVLTVIRNIDVDTTVTVTHVEPGAKEVGTDVVVPAGTMAGTSLALPVPVTATARILTLKMAPTPADNRPDSYWNLTVLLGNIAKLLWVVGAERDQLREHAVRTLAQRHLPSAVGLSLDLIGHDLGVPRFPPQPHGFDTATVALYHLDDAAAPVSDVTKGFPGRSGFPGTIEGPVQLGVAGRYGQAMGFRDPAAAVRIATNSAFDIGANGEFTIECFVRPDPTADGPVLSRHPAPDGDGPGWVLRIGKFDAGLDRDVRFDISDGTNMIDLYACVSLPTDRFTHLAVSFARFTGHITLYVDGAVKDFRFRDPLGAVVNTADLLIGAAAGGFRGTVDEVRISSAPRADFAPVLGEDDEHYRRRLALFRRWTLPTPANLAAVLNELVGPIGSDPDAKNTLVVDDTNATLVRGTRLVHILPKALLPGESIDAAGRRGTAEETVVGTAADEDTFDPAFLLRYDHPGVDFGTPPVRVLGPGEQAADPRRLQIGVAERLDRLITLTGAPPTPPGRLFIDSAFDPRADDLRATGRAVLLDHSSVSLGRLAALAHRAGFDYVNYQAGEGRIYAAAAPGDYFAIDLDPAVAGPTDIDAGTPAATLSLRPAPPSDAFHSWLLVPTTGGGRGTLTPEGVPGSPHRTAKLLATAAGRLIVKVDVTRGKHTVSATRALRVGLTDLPEGGKIAADGTTGVDASTMDRPEVFFDSAFLADHTDPRVDYASTAAHKMQPAVAELLDALLAELARRGIGGRLTVSTPSGDNLPLSAKQGRRLFLRHS
ncbi:MAG TPA: LamG domain-containing protein, partial [Amycolatopsis sp.]|nr:LamG domain-containing protein [Amycolatopsis sp.]